MATTGLSFGEDCCCLDWVDAAAAASLQAAVATGKPVYIPPGANLTGTEVLVTTPGQQIFGAGWDSIVTQGDLTKSVFKVRAAGVRFHNFRVNGILATAVNTDAAFAFFTESAYPAPSLALERILCSGADAAHGMHNFVVFDELCDDGVVLNCQVERLFGGTHGGGNGYGVLVGANRALVHGNEFHMGFERGRHGIYLSAGASGCRVTDNLVQGATYEGITVYAFDTQPACAGNVISGNRVVDCVWGPPNPSSTLTAGISSSATSVTVASGSAFSSPTGGAHAGAILEQGASREFIWITARSGNTLTVVRGQGGFSAVAFTTGARLTECLPAINAFAGAISLAWNCRDNVVSGNTVENSGGHGISVNGTGASGDADKTTGNLVTGNSVHHAKLSALEIKAMRGGVIASNALHEGGWYHEDGPGSMPVMRVVASDNADFGSRDLSITGNHLTGPAWSSYALDLNPSLPVPEDIKFRANKFSPCWTGRYLLNGVRCDFQEVSVLDFGARPDSGLDDAAAFQQALSAGGRIRVPAGSYTLATGIGIVQPGTELACDDGVTLDFAGGASTSSIVLYASGVRISGHPVIAGPSNATTYVSGEVGIACDPGLTDFVLEVQVRGFGFAGMVLTQARGVLLGPSSLFRDCGSIGCAFNDCRDVLVPAGVQVGDIRPSSNDGFGLLVGSNNNSGAPSFSRSVRIEGVVVENVAGDGIANQGNHEVRITGAQLFNCRRGIVCSTGSASASLQNYVSNGCEVADCLVTARKRDGTAGDWANAASGIVLDGVASPANTDLGIVARDNEVAGYGVKATETPAISARLRASVDLTDNTITAWNGVAIDVSSSTGQVNGALITDMVTATGETKGFCVLASGNGNFDLSVLNVNHAPKVTSGVPALVGFKTAQLTRRPRLSGNQFARCTTPVDLAASSAVYPTRNFVLGTDVAVVREYALSGGSTTLALSDFPFGTRELTVILYATAATTLTNITGLPPWTVVRLVVGFGSSNVTFNRTNAALAGGANWVGQPRHMLVLVRLADSMVSGAGYTWLEQSRSANS
ncbi:right-handed parallel beta-helix repeat-containing protein [Caenimonas sedimenti]|nr:right-handed parallel beta-helix repeat-containing protein [Caenimonas sedimenti]